MTSRTLIVTLGLALTLLACGKVGPPVRRREVPATDSVPSSTSTPATSESAGDEAENGESEEEPQ